jgi:hypothetical protein
MPDRPRRGLVSALIRPGLALALFCAAAAAGAQAPPHCVADANTLCFGAGDRFSVTASFQQSPEGPSFFATAVSLTADSGYFWFFDRENVELVVKVLDACALSPGAYWFFAAGLTNVGVSIVVKDLPASQTKLYTNQIGTPFAPIQDTGAFDTCP